MTAAGWSDALTTLVGEGVAVVAIVALVVVLAIVFKNRQ